MNRPGSPPPLWGAAGKAGYVLSCIAAALVLAISGFSYFVVKDVSAIGGSHAIKSGPSIGAQNILLMGLESRTDWNGNILPDDVLKALHACNAAEIAAGCGGNATNTLILIHIFANGGKAVGFSIPRDDWVTFPQAYDGQSQGKVDQAYGFALAAAENQAKAQNPSITQDKLAYAGNEAGRAAEVATVEQLTGVHIDHFAELNLDGFYELAKVVGGVQVCLLHPVPYDPYSGFSAKRAGYQHLSARLALAFVRQRHGLTNGDFDRTKRQQAVIDSVTKQLRDGGVLGDLGKLNALLSVASKYLITDQGWDLLEFIGQMRGLSLGNVSFRTLPEVAPITIEGQDANEINVPQIQQMIQQAFYPVPKPSGSSRASAQNTAANSAITVDVYNGGNTPGLAKQVSDALVKDGYTAGAVGNTSALTTTEVLYGTGAAANASQIASMFNVTASASSTVAAGHVQVMLGADATVPAAGASSSPSPSPSVSSPSASESSTAPGAGTVNAKNGIPCVS
ncbi:MAG TPA: LCP family protein [Streptosporangiaceae bacterium]|nr:LCP family protein [Streptosporangiaceae bacterium]